MKYAALSRFSVLTRSVAVTGSPCQRVRRVSAGRKAALGCLMLLTCFWINPAKARTELLTTQALKQQCQALMEGSQSLMSAFQSGQCSSYILGIYDIVTQQCPNLELNREQAVTQTLSFLAAQPDENTPAARLIDHFFSQKGRCLPVASL